MEPTGRTRLIDSEKSAEDEDRGGGERLSWGEAGFWVLGSGPRLREREDGSLSARCWSHQTSKFSFVQLAAEAVQCTSTL